MALNTQVTDAAKLISDAIGAGQTSARASVGGGGIAFGWTAGLTPTLCNYVTTATSSGMSFNATVVTKTANAAIVAPGALKPEVGSLTSTNVPLKKHAGWIEADLEAFLNAGDLGAAIASVLGQAVLASFEADAVAQLDAADTTPIAAGTDWVSAIAAGQAEILSRGGTPSVAVISAADYGAFVGDVVDRLVPSAESPVGAVLGTPLHISSGAPAGKAWVLDASAVICVSHELSPLLLVDAVSQATTNVTRLVGDLVASTFVVNPSLVAEITAPVLGARATTEPEPAPNKGKR